jgi:hypothetical protein
VLLDGVNHIAWISKDVAWLSRVYQEMFDAEVGPTRAHGQNPGETMTVIRIGPHTELNIFVIEGNTEADRTRWTHALPARPRRSALRARCAKTPPPAVNPLPAGDRGWRRGIGQGGPAPNNSFDLHSASVALFRDLPRLPRTRWSTPV